jgi:defect-in-organelle-trafficking protein DotB
MTISPPSPQRPPAAKPRLTVLPGLYPPENPGGPPDDTLVIEPAFKNKSLRGYGARMKASEAASPMEALRREVRRLELMEEWSKPSPLAAAGLAALAKGTRGYAPGGGGPYSGPITGGQRDASGELLPEGPQEALEASEGALEALEASEVLEGLPEVQEAPEGLPRGALAPGEPSALGAGGPPSGGRGNLSFEELMELMTWGRSQGVSDLVMTSDDKPWLRLGGEWRPAGNRLCRLGELASLLNRLTRNEAAAAQVASGIEMDFGCEIPLGRGRGARFRANASAVANGWGCGMSLTFRTLPETPPTLESLELEPELAGALFPDNGLVLVTGVMGSGKSTLLAAALRSLAERTRRHLATYESPIEFDLAGLPNRLGPVEQSEVSRHMRSFGAAARNVTRRAADVVLIGESRDPETIRSILEAAEIGVAAYTTVHSRSVAATVGRMIAVFDRSERAQAAAALISALRVIVQQRLYPRVGGGRLAVREWLVFDQDMREALQRRSIESLDADIEALVRARGQSLEAAVRKEAASGRLDREVLARVLAERRRADGA